MRRGWYIINYHDINFEDSILTRAIGGVIRPDVFSRQLQYLAKRVTFVSLAEGYERYQSGQLDRPYLTIWFDDGFKGLHTYALDICESFGVRPAVSICSRFVDRKEMFWRCKLSALAHLDGMRLLRAALRKHHERVPFKLRSWSLENYDERLTVELDLVYKEVTTPEFREHAFSIFMDRSDLVALKEHDWEIVNHSAEHAPWSQTIGWETITRSFKECEELVVELGGDKNWWVVPFDFGFKNYATDAEALDKRIVRVGNRVNQTGNAPVFYRYVAPEHRTRWQFFPRS